MRDVARGAATVAIVTTIDEHGPHGSTAAAFTALPVEPPIVLVSLDSSSELLSAIIRRTGRFGVSVLSADQTAPGSTFAGDGRITFDGVRWSLDHGVPRLPGTSGWFACVATSFVCGGSHQIVRGLVLDAGADPVGRPLTTRPRRSGRHCPAA